ncbi:hypothetical protein KC867_01460 [Candidatus Saccharibacteria bacterium]|nr:hypothetical protein [Candidatus Saccharibacteria bacterium]
MKARQKSKNTNTDIRFILLRVARVHYLYLLAYIVSLIIFDSANLITHEAIIDRFTAVGSLLVVNTIIWYLCKAKVRSKLFYQVLFVALILSDIAFASANVYWQRGMASKAVALFAVPIISAGLYKSRSLVLATAGLSSVVYGLSTIRYFFDNYGQGYRVELYGELFFYCSFFFVLAFMMMINFRKSSE